MEIEKVFLLLATQKRGLFFCSQAKVILQAVDTQAVASSSISSSLEKAFFVKSTLKLAWTFSCHPITTWTLENPSSVNRGERSVPLSPPRPQWKETLFFPMAKQCWWYSNDTAHDLLSGKPESAENPFWNPLLTWFLLQKFAQFQNRVKGLVFQFLLSILLGWDFSSHFQTNQNQR